MDLIAYLFVAMLLGMATAFVIGVIRLFLKFRKEGYEKGIIKNGELIVTILQLETVEHEGKDVYLVYEPLQKNRFITQGTSLEQVSAFIVDNFKGKTVFLAEEGKGMTKLFNYSENM